MIEFQLEFPSGVIGSCMSMYSANQSHILLMGERGRIELAPATGYSGNRLWVGRGRTTEITPPAGPGETQWAGQLDPPARCIAADRDPLVGGAAGLRALRVTEQHYCAARER